MDRNGKTQPLRPTANLDSIQFSPDGSRLAMDLVEQNYDIWIYEWARDRMTRLTFDPLQERNPIWTPDGRRITYRSLRDAKYADSLYWQPADGTGEAQRLLDGANTQIPMSWHPSGKFLAFRENRPKTFWDIMILPMEGDEASGWKPGKPSVFLDGPFNESSAAFSPHGKWLAYATDESGDNEVFVRPFPGPGGRWQISTNGGEFPTWSRNGKELFYKTPDQRIWVATYTADSSSFNAEKPRPWSEGTFTDRGLRVRNFDLHADGQRFAVLKTPESRTQAKLDHAVVIINFSEELRRLAQAPAGAP
jgi:Tol biopolymer transport system component